MFKKHKEMAWKVAPLVIVFLLLGGVAYGVTGVVNNYYGNTTVNQTSGEDILGGNVDATGGICNGSEPGVTMCNVDINNLDVTTALAVDGTATLSGELQAQKIVEGGAILVASTTLTSAKTLTAAEICNSSIISVNTAATTATLSAASLDITMAATSTLFADCLDTEGDKTSFIFVNASPTAATTTEMIAGTGCESFISQDTGGADTVAGLGAAKITLIRATDYMGVNATNDCIMITEPYIFD